MRKSTLAMIVLAATAHHAAAQLGHATIDTLAHGIVRVRNSGPTRWTGTGGWTLVPELTITADGTNALIAEPWSIAVDSRGDVLETDWKVDAIQEWDRTGKFIRTIGRKGQGPGEFEVPIDIAIRNDTLLAYASNEARVSLWHTDGKLIREWRVDFCCGGDPAFGAQGSIMIRMSVHANGSYRRSAIRWRPDGRIIDTIALPIEPPVRTWEVAHGEYAIPFSPGEVGTFNSRGEYVSGFGGTYALVVARHGGDTAQIIAMPDARVKLSVKVLDSVFAMYSRIPPLAGVAKRGDLPATAPYFTGLHVDEHDNVWIERLGSDGEVTSFDVIDPHGVFLGSAATPPGASGHFLFTHGRMYASGETPDGDIVINIYRIDRRGR